MPKNKVSEWSATASNNTDIAGINIAEGCAPSGINNAIRELMAQVKDMQTGTDADNFTVGGNLTVTGTATGTTPSTSDDSTKFATTAFVKDVALPDTSGNGIVARTGALTVTNRTITAGTGITVTNGDGVSGNPTIANSGVTSVNGSTGAVTVGIGVGQTWQDVASSRAIDTTYTNSTGKPIMVSVSCVRSSSSSSSAIRFNINGSPIAQRSTSESNGTIWNAVANGVDVIVPDGATYSVTTLVSASTIVYWYELR